MIKIHGASNIYNGNLLSFRKWHTKKQHIYIVWFFWALIFHFIIFLLTHLTLVSHSKTKLSHHVSNGEWHTQFVCLFDCNEWKKLYMFIFFRFRLDNSIVGHYLFGWMHWNPTGKEKLFRSERTWLFDGGEDAKQYWIIIVIEKQCCSTFFFFSLFIVIVSVFAGGMKCAKKNFNSYSVASVPFIRIVDRLDDTIMHIVPWQTLDISGHNQAGIGFPDQSIQIVCEPHGTSTFRSKCFRFGFKSHPHTYIHTYKTCMHYKFIHSFTNQTNVPGMKIWKER